MGNYVIFRGRFQSTGAWLLTLFMLVLHLSVATSTGKVIAFFQMTCDTALPNPCQQNCTDIKSGGFYCQCYEGYTINPDGMSCSPVDIEIPAKPTDSSEPESNRGQTESVDIPKGSGPGGESSSYINKDGEVVIKDSDVVRVKSIDLTKGLPPLESDAHSRPRESNLVLDRDFYNIPEGGSRDVVKVDRKFNYLNIPEGGSEDGTGTEPGVDERPEETNMVGPTYDPARENVHEGGESRDLDARRCQNDGTPIVSSTGKVSCNCPLGTYGNWCERLIEVRYPKFAGNGYLALPILRNGHKEFRVTLEFRPESLNGLVLFSGELASAKTDFFSVTLDDGYILFRFDCGTGVANLKTPNQISMDQWNRLTITRVDNTGTVQLNDGYQVEGSSPGDYSRITFRLNLYLGGYSDLETVSPRVGTLKGFDGCVQELNINGHHYDFRQMGLVGESEFGMNVGECSEGVCDNVNCENNGVCIAKSADEHVCLCPLGSHGERCEEESPVHIPHFSGHSFLEFPGLNRSVLAYTEVEIVFKPTSTEGLVLYNGFSRDRKGDFLSLAMTDGHLEFSFDLGTGPSKIRSYEPLALDQWHLVRASRTGLMGTLDIDGQIQVSGQSQGAYTQLTLMDNLYLGGHPNFDHTSKHANLTKSFTGCLQKVVVNQHNLDLIAGSRTGKNIAPCSHPCTGNPCMNGGECHPQADSYICYCPLGFQNTNCEDKQNTLPKKPMFSGHSYLVFTDERIVSRTSGSRMDIQLSIRPKSRDGLIFWSGEDLNDNAGRDFIAVGFHQGSLHLRFDLGSGEAIIGYNDSHLFDGNWHFLRVQRDKQDAYMEIDKREIVEGGSPGDYTSLNTEKIVFLGGVPDIQRKTGGRYDKGFEGCIKNLKMGTDFLVDLSQHAHQGRNIAHCKKKYFVN